MVVLIRSCCANVALTTAIAMTATAVCPAAQTLTLQTDKAAYSAVNSRVLTLASLESSLAAVDAPAQPAVSSPREVTQAVTPAVADEATPGDPVYDFAKNIANLVAVAVLPLWWIAFPVTFPIGLILLNFLYPPSPIYDPTPFRAMGLILGAVLFPGFVLNEVVKALFPSQSASTPTAALSASAVRSAVAPPARLSDAAGGSFDEAETPLKGDSVIIESAAARSKRTAKPAAEVMSTEALEERDDAPSVSKGKATSSRHPAGQRVAGDEAPKRS